MKTMTSKVIRSEYMTNTEEGHSKDYTVVIEEQSGKIVVRSEWGKIGADHRTSQVKYIGKDLTAAENEYNKIIHTRIAHGYRYAN